MNKLEQVSSDHQMSLAGGPRSDVKGVPSLISGGGAKGVGDLYSEVQCIISNGHMTGSSLPPDGHTPVKTLPSRNFVGGR